MHYLQTERKVRVTRFGPDRNTETLGADNVIRGRSLGSPKRVKPESVSGLFLVTRH